MMKKSRIALTSMLLTALACGLLTGCGKGDESSYDKPLDSADKEKLSELASDTDLLTGELTNKTIKWMANWDINPDGTGKKTPVELETFQSHYGGKVEYHNVDWNSRYDQLANAINGDEGIDFFPASDLDAFPKGAIKDMFVPIDDYIDFSEPAFAPMKDTMDKFVWKGKHYVIVNSVTGDNCVVIYNRDTIEENGLKDPAKLFEKGEWTWDTFQQQLTQFVDVDNGQFGIDGWWFEAGLSATCGVPYIDVKDGKLVNNLKDPAIERLQNWMYELGTTNCVAIGVGDYGWDAHPEYIGEGKTLFYPCGAWAMYNDTWKKGFGENAMFVPMPKDPNADKYYIPCGLDGYVMVKGGKNPEGVAIFAKCKRFAIMDEGADEIATKGLYDDYGWTDEMVQMLHKCHDMAKENPYYDFYNAISTEVSSIMDSNENGIRCTSKGIAPWSESIGVIYNVVDNYLNDYNK
ncbi:MAG: extracellular solute-binding protein [Oscillospiraceae bacterium]|nr:extracellular solute-binding protein [Oscillospiraceae bacterium]